MDQLDSVEDNSYLNLFCTCFAEKHGAIVLTEESSTTFKFVSNGSIISKVRLPPQGRPFGLRSLSLLTGVGRCAGLVISKVRLPPQGRPFGLRSLSLLTGVGRCAGLNSWHFRYLNPKSDGGI